MKERKSHIEFLAPVTEMDGSDISVPIDASLLHEVTDGDTSPRFVVVTINEQTSGNNIEYDEEAFRLIADQVNSKNPTGFLGHIKDGDRETAFPMPQVLWLGSTVRRAAGGVAQLVTKGYLIPEGVARDLLKRKVLNSVSWSGEAVLTLAKGGKYKMKEYNLESIDFARKGREGLKGQSLVVVTEEMGKSKREGRKTVARRNEDEHDDDYEYTVSHLTLHDLKAHNPALIRTIQEMAKDETKGEVAVAVKAREDELTTAHAAAIAAMPEKSIVERIREFLGVDKIEDVTEEVIALAQRLDETGKKLIQAWFNDEILAKKVPNENARKLIGRLVSVTEMQGDYRSEPGLDKIKKALAEKADTLLDEDEAVQTVINEMSSGRGGLRIGGTTRDVRDRRESEDRGGSGSGSDEQRRVERSGNLRYEEVPVV